MLATQRMSSHGGQLPFGYNPNAIHSIGLPEFLSPGEPMGQSILNDEESSTLNHFFSDFESNQPPAPPMPLQFAPPQSNHQPLFTMPPVYFGSETSDGTGPGIDPHTLQLDGQPHAYPNQPTYDLQILHVPGGPLSQILSSGSGVDDDNTTNTSNSNAANSHAHNGNGLFDVPLDQLQPAAPSVTHPQPGFTSNWNQQPYQPQGMPLQAPGRGPMMRFGSDSHFTQTGFQLPNSSGIIDAEDATLNHWLPSAPNSQPPTQPSSPNWSKKRKLDDVNIGNRRNGYHAGPESSNNGPGANSGNPGHATHRHQSLGQVKYEPHAGSQPLNRGTASHARSQHSDDHHSDEIDAAAESDDDPFNNNNNMATAMLPHSPSTAGLWSNSNVPPSQANHATPMGKPPRKRKKSTSTTPTVSTMPYPSGSNGLPPGRPKSSPTKSTRAPSTRVPLTTEQKKANHTNSEQRRRDATARAYAELYDLVPEVGEMGKQSTMKKLELVVDKVSWTISAVESLRVKLGIASGSNADLLKGHGTSYPGRPSDGFASHVAHAGIDRLENSTDACYPDLD
ncbi:hypothetical protein DV738_g236, partial [Chaetothyriales sp. CBS 135597]